ncbi:MAG: nuclear transport factor 2 family protein [Acidimicrobiales bacterium]|nr:nuclear transport factor 2 family protein [Acidimicrobiales bacterium]
MSHRDSPPPPADDLEATVRWLRDRTLLRDLYNRYAYGVDSLDFDLVRTVFHPDCVFVGTLEEGTIDDYLHGLEEGLLPYDASMHLHGNDYTCINGDEASIETWVVNFNTEPPGAPIENLVLGLRYKDEVVRVGDDWKIIQRETTLQWFTGPFPRPYLGPPPYPRASHESSARHESTRPRSA